MNNNYSASGNSKMMGSQTNSMRNITKCQIKCKPNSAFKVCPSKEGSMNIPFSNVKAFDYSRDSKDRVA